MKAQFILIPTMVLLVCLGGAQAMFTRPQLQALPIDRVLLNLQQRLARNRNDVEALYDLGRVHSMAYATNLVLVNVSTKDQRPVFAVFPGADTGVPEQITPPADPRAQAAARQHLTNAIFYYQRAAARVSRGTNAAANQWLALPIRLGLAWCLDQEGRRAEAIKAYRKALQLAWQREVGGTTAEEQHDLSWDQIRARKNPAGNPPVTGHIGPGPCYSDEIIGYLLKLLDPVKDAKEIAQLQQDRQTLLTVPRAITPILVSLEPNTPLAELVNPGANVAFDLDGSDAGRRWGWITPKAAWLVFDHDGSGRITSGLQMLGNVTFWIFWRDGYDALSALDDDGDGTLKGLELRGLSLWRDLNGNGISEPGEVRPLTDWGVVAIQCGSEKHSSGIPFQPRGVVLRDGSTRATFDWIVPSPANQPLAR